MRRLTIIAVVLLLTVSLHAQTTDGGSGHSEMESQNGDFVGRGLTYNISPEDGIWVWTIHDVTGDHVPDVVRIAFTANGPAIPRTNSLWIWEFNTYQNQANLVAGTVYADAMKASEVETGKFGVEAVTTGGVCDTLTGNFTVTRFEWCFSPNAVDPDKALYLKAFEATFEQHCEGAGPALTGTVFIESSPANVPTTCEDGSGDGGGSTPPPPPPPFQISVPVEFDIDPLVLGNTASHKIKFTTGVTSSFNSDIHLSVETDALEHEDFHASITPSVIPAPGAGEGELTITTGPTTFPRVYTVKLIASANDQVFERTFLVHIQCDPPTILGTNQPKSITAANGSQVTLEVTPSGTGPFSYQWYKGFPGMTRNPVLAANESKLIFTTRETATYWVRVTNACGTVNSTSATVTTTGTLSGPARRRGAN